MRGLVNEGVKELELIQSGLKQIEASRFSSLIRLCLRQNRLSEVPRCLPVSLKELDLYDNMIVTISGLDDLIQLEWVNGPFVLICY